MLGAKTRFVHSLRGSRHVARAEIPFDASSIVGDKLGRWLKTPFDVLTFGPRASAGALVSAPERLQTLQYDLEKAWELVQDPRPISEKQEVLLQLAEVRVLELLERGADVETDVLANIKTALPTEVANILTEFIPEPPSKQSIVHGDFSDMPAADATDVPTVTYGKADVAASQISSQISEIRLAVSGLKGALEEIKNNTDPAKSLMLKLNLREARDQLGRRIQEVSSSEASSSDDTFAAALREASILLDEVNFQFFSEAA
ncbi:hypothetical protein CEUSTIGMA_g8102.t1 [Chlamydomonas eustigma]|uniref:Uncharacterized protein n=1 Tax=Chlamydomonas eustigma TaxID=1157962 RepID=A0A250XC49_9CHLO|nr:hypothetical protein CEUSTIGMA_g8102.t1 [Chlamydomonas eustigma]|eukprot:GAX80667.1 hypothetical protein CEUSTIGMA_g8102.t1 [Chlamydomonas eustigma]